MEGGGSDGRASFLLFSRFSQATVGATALQVRDGKRLKMHMNNLSVLNNELIP